MEVEVAPLAGPAVRGTLAAWESQSLAIDAAGGRKSFPLDQLSAVAFVKAASKPAGPIAVETIDGSSLVGATLTAGPSGVVLGNEAGSVELPTAAVRSVRLQPHNDATWEQGLATLQGVKGGNCVAGGHPCMACTEKGYPDAFLPFVVR